MPRNFVTVSVKERGTVPRRLQSQINKSTKYGLHSAAEWHHKENVPDRFTQEHGRKARYYRRSREYEARKSREGRGNDPMVYSGRTRARANVARISSNSKRATLTYSLPALNFTVGARSRKHTMRSEFERVLWQERRYGQRLAIRKTNEDMRRNNATSRRRLV